MRTTSLGLALAGLLLSACTTGGAPAPKLGNPASLGPLDASASLTAAGRAMLDQSDFKRQAPRIDVTASADPKSGRVAGVMHARIPIGPADELHLRYFAGVDSMKASAADGPVTVDGKPADATLDEGLLTIRLSPGHPASVTVEVPFSYTLPRTEVAGPLDSLGGGTLEPAQIGLLARHSTELSLGHWFPIWVPPGRRADPQPKGFGDISNYPAADLSVRLTVPKDWTVIDSGVRVGETTKGGRTTVTSYATGMRDISVVVVKGYESKSRRVGYTMVRAWGPAKDAKQLDGVLDETAAAIGTLSEDFGAYPWKEFDVVSTPLGAGVSGMEWPGATWIESSAFAGGIPGLGSLGDLTGPILDRLGDLGVLLSSTRAWTIAHEVGHMWWTILVGNDSIADPVVDEPLAQYSACLVARETLAHPDKVCELQIASAYGALKDSGGSDSKADQPTDEFSSATQYGGVIYGKAAWFYLALEKAYGADRVRRALHDAVSRYAFETVTGRQLRWVLVTSLDEPAGSLWDHWMEQEHGDADMPKTDLGMGDLLGNLDLKDLLGH
jgi:hypothetical protein